MGQSPGRFIPSVDGFAFDNSWPSQAAVRIPTPLGTIGIGNAARGLCGGMVFAALDYWHAGRRPPVPRPAPGTALYRFIVRRLIESWHLPTGVATYYQWMLLPDADQHGRAAGRSLGLAPGGSRGQQDGAAATVTLRGLRRRTICDQWPRIKNCLDGGRPLPLGIVTVAGPNPLLLGHNHQVLACAYRQSDSLVTIQVYDPNSGPRDDVFIRFDTAQLASTPHHADASRAAGEFAHNVNVSWPVRGFFAVGYSPAPPPPG
ncbi:MAG TPA: hypothetical protein VGI58_03905 [Streptosporangiaceae bacterium]